jgi:magnesium-transporting ATPase (P-type)
MGKKKVIVKNINSIQNFGAMDVLCTDKTGTLTQDRVALEDHLNVNGVTDYRVLRHAFLNSYFQTGLKNLMDQSIISKTKELSAKLSRALQNLDKIYTKVDEIPFDFERKRMSVVVKDASGKTQMITKGALEEILGDLRLLRSRAMGVVPLDEILKKVGTWSRIIRAKASGSSRWLRRTILRPSGPLATGDEKDMVLIGYLIFFDPPKESTAKRSSTFKEYGVTTKVLTGDSAEVAEYIFKLVGLPFTGVLLGKDVEAMDQKSLRNRGRKMQSLRQTFARGQGPGGPSFAGQWPRGRLHGRWDQRCPGLKSRRYRHLGRHGGRYRQGKRPRDFARKRPRGARRWHHRRPQDLRQHDQIHQDDGLEQLRQHLLRARRRRLFALLADAAAPAPFAEFDL